MSHETVLPLLTWQLSDSYHINFKAQVQGGVGQERASLAMLRCFYKLVTKLSGRKPAGARDSRKF